MRYRTAETVRVITCVLAGAVAVVAQTSCNPSSSGAQSLAVVDSGWKLPCGYLHPNDPNWTPCTAQAVVANRGQAPASSALRFDVDFSDPGDPRLTDAGRESCLTTTGVIPASSSATISCVFDSEAVR